MNEEQQQAVAHMMEITACDETVAATYLERCEYDIESAIRYFFEGSMPPVRQNGGQNDEQDDNEEFEEVQRAVVADNAAGPAVPVNNSNGTISVYHSVVQFFASMLVFPIRLPFALISFVFDYFFARPTVEKYKTMHDYIAKNYEHYLRKKNNFYGKTLAALKNEHEAKGYKYIVAYIHDPRGDRTFLMNCFETNLARMISEHRGVLFGTVLGSDDAAKLFPSRGFISKRQSVCIFTISGTSLSRRLVIENLSDPLTVNTNIRMALMDLMAEDAQRELNRTAQAETRRLMDEQNREYEESLRKDLEKRAKMLAEKEAEEKARKEEEDKINQSKKRADTVRDYKKTLLENATPSVGSCEVLIRFPAGKKVVKFELTDSIEKLFHEALIDDKCPLYFQMHTSIPKAPIACLPKWYHDILESEELEPKQECLDQDNLTFKQAGISHGILIYVDNM